MHPPARPLRDKLFWNQTTTEIVATVDLPRGTSRSEVDVAITTCAPSHMEIWDRSPDPSETCPGTVKAAYLTRTIPATPSLFCLNRGARGRTL